MKTYIDNGFLYYYDTNIRYWTIYEVDKNMNQVSEEAEHFYDKKQLKQCYPMLEFKPE